MSTKHTATVGIALVAFLLVTFAFVAAPKAPAAAPAAARFVSVASAYAAEEAAAPAEGEAAAGEAKGEAEIPHTTGKLTDQQKADLTAAWEGVPGYNLLILSILSLLVMVGVVGFGVVKQARA